jgi:hypothetical protein
MALIENWFSLVMTVFAVGIMLWMVQRGKQGITAYLRELPAVTALGEGVRRATEMGRPVYFAPGTMPITQGTYGGAAMAGLTVLRYVSKLCAEQHTPLVACICRSVNIPIANEAVKLGCIEAGAPEEEARQTVYYMGESQNLLTYASMMQKDEAGCSIVFGSSGATTMMAISAAAYKGIFQVVGNTEVYNCCWLPPMCDYWLAIDGPQCAAAYTSGDPEITNTVFGTDILKLVFVGLFIVAYLLLNAGVDVEAIFMS